MSLERDVLILVLLGVTFAGVGLYVVVYSRRRAAVFRRFARSRGYRYRERDDGSLEGQLQHAFAIREPGCARAFGQISDIVDLPSGTLFRAVELLDLNPHGSVFDPHHARAAVLFRGAPEWSGIFHVTPDLAVHPRYAREPNAAAAGIAQLFRSANVSPPPHPLSLTFMNGHGLGYLEPPLTGSVTEPHLVYLTDMAARFAGHSSEAPGSGGRR